LHIRPATAGVTGQEQAAPALKASAAGLWPGRISGTRGKPCATTTRNPTLLLRLSGWLLLR
jgi:hypothetical protein